MVTATSSYLNAAPRTEAEATVAVEKSRSLWERLTGPKVKPEPIKNAHYLACAMANMQNTSALR